jgi:hypothetical protein
MVQKLKGSDTDTQSAAKQLTRRKQPGAGSTRRNSQTDNQKRDNQKRMGVEPDHRTTSMKRGRRGTYP